MKSRGLCRCSQLLFPPPLIAASPADTLIRILNNLSAAWSMKAASKVRRDRASVPPFFRADWMKKTLENGRDCEAWRYFFWGGLQGKKEILAGVFKADSDPRERVDVLCGSCGWVRKIEVSAVSPIPLSLNHITSVHILLLTFKTLLPLCQLAFLLHASPLCTELKWNVLPACAWRR